MKFKSLFAVKTGLFLLLSFMSCVANAKLIKFTMDMDVYLASPSPYLTVAAGDTFQFIAIYDDESQFAYRLDGSLACLPDYASLHRSECDVTTDKLDLVDNPSLINIGDLFDVEEMIKDGGVFSTHLKPLVKAPFLFAFRKIKPNHQGYNGINFTYFSPVLGDGNTIYTYESSTYAFTFFYYDNKNKMKHASVHYSISNMNSVALNVPEPSTLAVFALGIMGLASRRFKKQS